MRTKRRNTRRRRGRSKMRGGTVKQSCAPSRNQKPVPGSCFETDTLVKMKHVYNSRAMGGKVEADAPAKIAEELDTKLSGKCSVESCWLDELNIPDKQKIKSRTFAPKHPDSWRKNPREWLSNEDIDKVIEQYEYAYPDFEGIPASAMDFDFKYPDNSCVEEELCKFSLKEMKGKGITKLGAIFNLDKHTQSGSHWVALFLDIKHKYMFYLDSAGGGVTPEVKRFMATVQKQGAEMSPPIKFQIRSNYPHTHQRGNTECGMYAIYFVSTLASSNLSLKEVMRIFASKHRITDDEMAAKRSEMFNDVV